MEKQFRLNIETIHDRHILYICQIQTSASYRSYKVGHCLKPPLRMAATFVLSLIDQNIIRTLSVRRNPESYVFW